MRRTGHSIALTILASIPLVACDSDDVSPTSSPAQSAVALASLEDLDDTATLDAVDAEGRWAEIELRRGSDTGGYPMNAIDGDAFVVEVWVQYTPKRPTDAIFGADDWALATSADLVPIGRAFIPDPPANRPWDTWTLDPLPRGFTTDVATVEMPSFSGWLYFEVPRDAEGESLSLIYRPEGFEAAVAAVPVRAPADAPAPVATATPDPTPAPLAYEPRPDAPFTVIVDEQADRLFGAVDTCMNPDAGYTLSYPDSWYTNTAIGPTPACSWFSPTFFEVDGAGIPDEIAIVIRSFEGGVGFVHQPIYTIAEPVTVDGWAGSRAEELGGMGVDGFLPPTLYTYEYRIQADADDFGLHVFVRTSNEMGGDYELNKAIVDRIVATMRFDR